MLQLNTRTAQCLGGAGEDRDLTDIAVHQRRRYEEKVVNTSERLCMLCSGRGEEGGGFVAQGRTHPCPLVEFCSVVSGARGGGLV